MDQLFNQSDYQGPVQVASDHAEELPPRYGYGYARRVTPHCASASAYISYSAVRIVPRIQI